MLNKLICSLLLSLQKRKQMTNIKNINITISCSKKSKAKPSEKLYFVSDIRKKIMAHLDTNDESYLGHQEKRLKIDGCFEDIPD